MLFKKSEIYLIKVNICHFLSTVDFDVIMCYLFVCVCCKCGLWCVKGEGEAGH